jgi:hypothetical protein
MWDLVVTFKDNADLGGGMGQIATSDFDGSIHLSSGGYTKVNNLIYERMITSLFKEE